MKSTALKSSDSTLIKKYAAIFALCFVIAILLFTEHFFEDAVTRDELGGADRRGRIGADVGNIAPDFALRNLEGNLVRLSDLRGRVVVVNLWATWCAPCRIEMPGIENLWRRFRSEGLTILAVSIDKGADQAVRAFVQEKNLSFPVLMDHDREVERKYPTRTVPTTFVVDKDRLIAARVDGAKNWQSEETFRAIEFLLKKESVKKESER